MSLTTDHLQKLTDKLNTRLEEFEGHFEPLSLGIVRLGFPRG